MKKLTIIGVYGAMALMILVAGCVTQKRATDVEDVKADAMKSGFLQDYSDLKQGNETNQGLLHWKDESAAWGTYDKIIIKPVEIWGDAKKDTEHQQDLVALANHATKAFVNAFNKYPAIKVVDQPGPGTVIMRFAITDAEPNNPTMKAISTVLPFGLAASAVSETVTDKPSFAGQIQAELMLVDVMTDKVIAKAVDRRVGGRSLETVSNSWEAAYDAIDAYAAIAVYRLCLFRGDKNCPVPKS